MDGLGQTGSERSGDHAEDGEVNGHTSPWAAHRASHDAWSSAGAALEPPFEPLTNSWKVATPDRRGIEALSGSDPADDSLSSTIVHPRFTPYTPITEDPYADELAQRSAEFARHAAFDDPTPPTGMPQLMPPSPHSSQVAYPQQAPPTQLPPQAPPVAWSAPPPPPVDDSGPTTDPPLAAQLTLGQRFGMAFGDLLAHDNPFASDDALDEKSPAPHLDEHSTTDLRQAKEEPGDPLPRRTAGDSLTDNGYPPPGPFVGRDDLEQADSLGRGYGLPQSDSLSRSGGLPSYDSLGRALGLPATDSLGRELGLPQSDSLGRELGGGFGLPQADSLSGGFGLPQSDSLGLPPADSMSLPTPEVPGDVQGLAQAEVPDATPDSPSRRPEEPLGPAGRALEGSQSDVLSRGPGVPSRRLGVPQSDPGRGVGLPLSDPLRRDLRMPSSESLERGLGLPPADTRGGIGSGLSSGSLGRFSPARDAGRPAAESDDTEAGVPQAASGEGEELADDLPQRIPAEPDVPAQDEVKAQVDEPSPLKDKAQLSRIASHLRREDVPTGERPDGFDVQAVLAAVRAVAGIREASMRTTPTGAHHLRLELAEGADPGAISRMVAQMLQDQMGIDAALMGQPGPQPSIPTQAEPAPETPQVMPPRPRSGLGAAPPAATENRPESPRPFDRPEQPREPRRRHPVSVPRRPLSDLRPSERAAATWRSTGGEGEQPGSGAPPAIITDRETGPRAIIEHVQTSTFGLDATVEVRLTAGQRQAAGVSSGPAVDAYVLRLCAAATAAAVDDLLRDGTSTGETGRCFIENAAIVPMGSCDVAVVVVLLVCGGWVEQLAGSALVSGDPRRAVVRATLSAVNRRLAALLP